MQNYSGVSIQVCKVLANYTVFQAAGAMITGECAITAIRVATPVTSAYMYGP